MHIETIDCEYTLPRYAAAYLLVEDGRAAFIENNTVHAVPLLLAALARHGLEPDAVDLCIITHVHLDHAGGSSALMKACPNATLLAHPRAAPHAIDPSKLVGSARAVYGPERFFELYGDIDPIPAERVRIMEDEETVGFAGRTLRFLHTRGHANHHFVVHDQEAEAIFTGDAFGLVYPDLGGQPLFALPSTSPTDFDGPLARASVDRIVHTGAKTAYLTHFGPVTEIGAAADQLKDTLLFSEAVLEQAYRSELPDEQLEAFIAPKLRAHLDERLRTAGARRGDDAWARLAMDLELNAQGLAFVAQKRRKKDRAS